MLDLLLSRFKDEPALVAPEKQGEFEACLSALAKDENFAKLMGFGEISMADDFWFSPDDWRAQYRPYIVRDGILVIPVQGVLLRGFPWQIGSYATGHLYIQRAWERGMEDPAVKGIALMIHSPGGDASECFDRADKMASYVGRKPTRAFVYDMAYSAGYVYCSVPDTVIMSRTAGVGSIGVVVAHLDMSKAMDEAGLKITFVHFGKHKVDGNPYAPLPADVKSRYQDRVDALGEVFVATVARNRGLSEQAVRDTEALTYSADEAVAIGLADEVGPLDDAVASFAAYLKTCDHHDDEEGEEQMTEKATAAVEATAIETARNDGLASGKALGAKEERERIAAILNSPAAASRPAAAKMFAFKLAMPADEAIANLGDLPEERAVSRDSGGEQANRQNFDAAMSTGNPDVGADAAASASSDRVRATLAHLGLTKTA